MSDTVLCGQQSIQKEWHGNQNIASMVNACHNPECKKELHYLREGRVVRIVHGEGDAARLEHFWLCGPCCRMYEFVFERDGSVSLKVRRDGGSTMIAA
jgi:hypothetical protein